MAKQSKLQSLRFGDSYFNLIVGIIVVVAIGAIVIGFIRGRGLPSPTEKEETEEMQLEQVSLPAKHTVAKGEDLWKISEKYYKTGYNWVDIASENKLANPNAIAEGMELTVPNVAPRVPPTQEKVESISPTQVIAQPTPTTVTTQVPPTEAITGTSYTVVKGDHLWAIAVRAYGDGYRWVEIARTNKLVNPNIIHPGNSLTLPR